MKIFKSLLEEFREVELSEEDVILEDIITKMCKSLETKLVLAPDTDRYFLKNERLGYYVMLTYDYIKVANHDFHLMKSMNMKQGDRLIKMVRARIESDRDALELEIFNNQVDLLKKISKNLD